MARLPLTYAWNDDLITARLRFLEKATSFTPPSLRTEMEENLAPQSPSKLQPLLVAADLSLATDRTAEGLRFLRLASTTMLTAPADLGAVALLGAITGLLSTRLFKDVVEIRTTSGVDVALHAVYPPLTPSGLRLMTDFLCACIATNSPDIGFRFGREPETRSALGVVAGLQPLVATLAAFGVVLQNQDDVVAFREVTSESVSLAHAALRAMAFQWARRLSLLQADRHHWRYARVRGPLVEMQLLALELAILRRPEAAYFRQERLLSSPSEGLAGDLERFALKLAEEIEAGRTI